MEEGRELIAHCVRWGALQPTDVPRLVMALARLPKMARHATGEGRTTLLTVRALQEVGADVVGGLRRLHLSEPEIVSLLTAAGIAYDALAVGETTTPPLDESEDPTKWN